MVFLTILLDDGRIRIRSQIRTKNLRIRIKEAQIHTDPTDPEHSYKACPLRLQLNKTVSHHDTYVPDMDPTLFFSGFRNAPKIQFFLCFVQGAQHPRTFGQGHIGQGHINPASFFLSIHCSRRSIYIGLFI
jgi:hypothetical protein